jgi:hypothetical protein
MVIRKKSTSASGRVPAKGARRATGVRRKAKEDAVENPRAERNGGSEPHDEAATVAAGRAPRARATTNGSIARADGAGAESAAAPSARPRVASAAPAPAAPPRPIVRSGPRPVVVARGEDSTRVFNETLKHSGFFDAIENAQLKSGKKRELFEVVCKVDFMRGVRLEPEPVSYVDPKLVAQLFNELLDRGFRILRVVESRNELARYLSHRSVKEVGKALGYDESCYELKDLGDELAPVDLGTAGRRATGRVWKQADFRIVFAKNRTDEALGPALVVWNVVHTLATPTDLIALEYGIDPGDLAIALLEKLPVHFALIDAVHSRDGSPGNVFPYELLRGADGAGGEGAQVHRLGTVLAGADVLAVEAAGHKMQGLDPIADPVALQKLRKAAAWKPPAEVDALPTFPGWKGIGSRIRGLIGADKVVEGTRLGILAALAQADGRLFPPLASGWQALRLRQKVETFVDELRRRHGVAVAASSGPSAPASPEFEDESDEGDDEEPPRF